VLVHPGGWAVRRSAGREPRERPTARPPDRQQAEIDRVLDKISARGMSSLTPEERTFLEEMSRKKRDRE
jgi:hypothetical protein